jgi:hypothetical protein
MVAAPTASWLASDGKTIHTDYTKYIRHELELLFTKASDNSVAAKAIVASINEKTIGDLAELLDILGAEMTKPTMFNVVHDKPPVTESSPVLRLANQSS